MTYHVPDDVIRRAQRGDREAQTVIVTTYSRPLTSTAYRFLGTRHSGEIEDCVHDIFLKVLAHLADFDFARNVKFSTWIYTFARNFCFDRMRKRRLVMTSLHGTRRSDGEDFTVEPLGPDEPPAEIAAKTEFRTALGRALDLLPAGSRRIVQLHAFHGLEFHQIARQLKMPLGTIKSKYYRACDRLKLRLHRFRLAV